MSATTTENLLKLAQLQIEDFKARERCAADAYHKLEAERDHWMQTATKRGEEVIELRNKLMVQCDPARVDLLQRQLSTCRESRLVEGILVRAGTFPAGSDGEEVTGFVVACSRDELVAIPRLPMYRRVAIHVTGDADAHPTIPPEAQAAS